MPANPQLPLHAWQLAGPPLRKQLATGRSWRTGKSPYSCQAVADNMLLVCLCLVCQLHFAFQSTHHRCFCICWECSLRQPLGAKAEVVLRCLSQLLLRSHVVANEDVDKQHTDVGPRPTGILNAGLSNAVRSRQTAMMR